MHSFCSDSILASPSLRIDYHTPIHELINSYDNEGFTESLQNYISQTLASLAQSIQFVDEFSSTEYETLLKPHLDIFPLELANRLRAKFPPTSA